MSDSKADRLLRATIKVAHRVNQDNSATYDDIMRVGGFDKDDRGSIVQTMKMWRHGAVQTFKDKDGTLKERTIYRLDGRPGFQMTMRRALAVKENQRREKEADEAGLETYESVPLSWVSDEAVDEAVEKICGWVFPVIDDCELNNPGRGRIDGVGLLDLLDSLENEEESKPFEFDELEV